MGNERKIVNVAAGMLTAWSTDAVNGGSSTATARGAAFGGGAGLDVNGQLTAPSYTIGHGYNDVGSAFTAVNTTQRDGKR